MDRLIPDSTQYVRVTKLIIWDITKEIILSHSVYIYIY